MNIKPQRIDLDASDLEELGEILGHEHDDVEGEWVEELAESMRVNGFDAARPIVVMANPDGSLMTLCDGRHRRAAALRSDLSSVPALLITFDEHDELESEHHFDSDLWYPALLALEA